jgi:hypothetical protein
VLVRASLFFMAAVTASGAIACSSLTKPDEIQIYAEPPPKPAAAPAPGVAPGQPARPAGANQGG